jgi:Ca2+-binding EF-hand superfamily protein
LIQIVRRTEEEKKKNFQSLDADGDGKIDQDEVDISIISCTIKLTNKI